MSVAPDTPAAAPVDGTGGASRSARVKEFGSQLHQMVLGGDDYDPPPADEQPTPKFDAAASAGEFNAGRGGIQPVQSAGPMMARAQHPLPSTHPDLVAAQMQANAQGLAEAKASGVATGARVTAALARPPVAITQGLGGIGGMAQSDAERLS
jgi:hypothetical protein